jgi:hypothetical protein
LIIKHAFCIGYPFITTIVVSREVSWCPATYLPYLLVTVHVPATYHVRSYCSK